MISSPDGSELKGDTLQFDYWTMQADVKAEEEEELEFLAGVRHNAAALLPRTGTTSTSIAKPRAIWQTAHVGWRAEAWGLSLDSNMLLLNRRWLSALWVAPGGQDVLGLSILNMCATVRVRASSHSYQTRRRSIRKSGRTTSNCYFSSCMQ